MQIKMEYEVLRKDYPGAWVNMFIESPDVAGAVHKIRTSKRFLRNRDLDRISRDNDPSWPDVTYRPIDLEKIMPQKGGIRLLDYTKCMVWDRGTTKVNILPLLLEEIGTGICLPVYCDPVPGSAKLKEMLAPFLQALARAGSHQFVVNKELSPPSILESSCEVSLYEGSLP